MPAPVKSNAIKNILGGVFKIYAFYGGILKRVNWKAALKSCRQDKKPDAFSNAYFGAAIFGAAFECV